MAVKRLSVNLKTRDDVFDQITPNNKYASDYSISPAGEFKPAAWLPILWKDTVSKDAFVISSGKVVAFDSTGRVVPAGLRTKLQSGITYTADDVTYGVIDLTTGLPVTAAVTHNAATVVDGLIERGLVLEDDVTDPTDETEVVPAFIGLPVGICAYDVYVWAGDAPGELNFHNYQKQHLIQYLRQIQLIVPHMVTNPTTDLFDVSALDAAPTSYAAGVFVDAGELWEAAEVSQLARYSDLLTSSSPVVALGLSEQPVAKNTERTPFTCDDDTVLLRERTSPDLIAKAGDWYLDAEVGVLFLSSVTWAAEVAANDDPSFSYDAYDNAGGAGDRYIHLDGRAKAGDLVTYDAESNLVVTAPTTVAGHLAVVGQIDMMISQPKGYLEKVKTAWSFDGADKTFKMPGSATQGFSDLITLTDETVADQLAVVWIRI